MKTRRKKIQRKKTSLSYTNSFREIVLGVTALTRPNWLEYRMTSSERLTRRPRRWKEVFSEGRSSRSYWRDSWMSCLLNDDDSEKHLTFLEIIKHLSTVRAQRPVVHSSCLFVNLVSFTIIFAKWPET